MWLSVTVSSPVTGMVLAVDRRTEMCDLTLTTAEVAVMSMLFPCLYYTIKEVPMCLCELKNFWGGGLGILAILIKKNC